MRSFRDLSATAVEWIQRNRRTYDLKSGEETFATLEWQSAFGSLAVGTLTDAVFTFKRGGFLSPHVTVRAPGSDADLATLHMGFWSKATLVFPDGRRYEFERRGIWNPEWTFSDSTGRRLCGFTKTAFLLKRQSRVTLEVDPRDVPDLALLVLLGWYTIILQEDEAAGAAVSALPSV